MRLRRIHPISIGFVAIGLILVGNFFSFYTVSEWTSFGLGSRYAEVSLSLRRSVLFLNLGMVVLVIAVIIYMLFVNQEQEELRRSELEERLKLEQLERAETSGLSAADKQEAIRSIDEKFRQRISRQHDLKSLLFDLCELTHVGAGALYLVVESEGSLMLKWKCSFGTDSVESDTSYSVGEGIIGQVAFEKKTRRLWKIPRNRMKVHSALGNSDAIDLLVVPLLDKEVLVGVVELAYLSFINENDAMVLEQTSQTLAKRILDLQSKSKTSHAKPTSSDLETEQLKRSKDARAEKSVGDV